MSSSISDPASPDYNPSTTAIRETLNPSPSLPPQPFVASGARRSGNFPAFGRPPATANNQITPLQREILQAELAAARAEQQADRAAAARYRQRLAELQTLAGLTAARPVARSRIRACVASGLDANRLIPYDEHAYFDRIAPWKSFTRFAGCRLTSSNRSTA
jgi:hypothetical protein